MKLPEETLMQLHDGELEAERARAVRAGLLDEPRVEARLRVLGKLGAVVRLWAAEAGVDAALERRRLARARARRRVFVACAAAALVAPWLLAEPDRAGAGTTAPFSLRSARGEPVVASGPVAVEAVDFGARSGAIFRVRGDAASATTVVWLPDDPGVALADSL